MSYLAIRRLTVMGAVLGASFGGLAPAAGSEAQAPSNEQNTIVVTGYRMPETLDGVPLIDEIQPSEIAGYGDDTLADLLSDLQRTGGDTLPLVLLNGRPIFNQSELSDVPTESIARIEVYPAPAALRFGGSAGQRTMNFVLRRQFRSMRQTLAGGLATEGGGGNGDAAFSLTRFLGDNRLTIGVKAAGSGRLLESQRRIQATPAVFATPGKTVSLDDGRFRTLRPEQRRFSLNAAIARQVNSDVNISLNAGGNYERSHSLRGLLQADGLAVDLHPLRQDVRAIGGYAEMKADAELGSWSMSASGEFGHRRTTTLTEFSQAPTPASSHSDDRISERARSHLGTGGLVLLASGPLLDLPTGAVHLSLRGDLSRSSFKARVARSDFVKTGHRDRTDAGVWLDAEVPITTKGGGSASILKGLSGHLNAGFRSVSDIRTLHNFGYALSWGPRENIHLNASIKYDRQPPSLLQLASPAIETSAVRFFDYVGGRTVEPNQLSGGNPELRADHRRTLAIGMDVLPFGTGPLRISVGYKSLRIDDPIAGLPASTAPIQAAFPERFVRDANGSLVRVDRRLINLAREKRMQLHWGVVMRRSLSRSAAADAGSGEAMGSSDDVMKAGANLRLSFNHTWVIKDKILLRRGLPELDLLHGGASGDDGGQPHHLLQWELGAFGRGLGARLLGSWQSGTIVRGGPGAATDALRFSPLMQHDLRLFADLGDRLPGDVWARGFRLSMSVANLLNQRQKVRDASGATPLRYQPGYVDPLGRSVRVELRKALF